MQNSKRVVEFDAIRGLCIIGILFLHISAYFLAPALAGLNSYKVSLVINQFVRFFLPMFIFFSGFGLATSYKGGSIGEFYRKRMNTVLVPYLVWSLVYFLFSLFVLKQVPMDVGMVPVQKAALQFPGLVRQFLINLVFGWNYVHLYFVTLIIQFYLIFPFAVRMLAPLKRVGLTLALLAAIYFGYMVVVFYHRESLNIPAVPFVQRYYAKLFISWFFYFFAGIVAAQHFNSYEKIARRYFNLTGVLFVLTSLLVIGEAWQLTSWQPAAIGRLTSLRPSVFLNTLMFIFCLYPMGTMLLKWKVGSWLVYIKDISFSLFFNHLLVLAVVSSGLKMLNPHLFSFKRLIFVPVLSLAVLALSIGCSILIDKLPISKYLGGR